MDTTSRPAQGTLMQIQAVLEHLKPAEKRIAEFILKSPHEVLSLTINELAAKTDTSYSTATRLITHLGFPGFKEFKKVLYQDTLNNSSVGDLNAIAFSQDISTKEICQDLFTLSSHILEESYQIADIAALEQAAQGILDAKSVCFVGTGMSGLCAKYAYSRFFRIGIPCFYDEDITHYKMKTSLLTPSDVLFAVSSSGRSESVIECARIAHENQVPIISLCDFSLSPLSKLSDINLFTTPRNSSQFMSIDMPLLIGQIFLINVLHITCCMKMGKHSSELYTKTKQMADLEKLK